MRLEKWNLKSEKYHADSIPFVVECDRTQFAKMFPSVCYDGRYIFWIQLNLYWEYALDSIACELKVRLKSGREVEVPDLRCRKLFPNRLLHTACLKTGRKLCDCGVILHFETFEELSEIRSIEFTYKISVDGENYSTHASCETHFEKVDGLRNYSLRLRAASAPWQYDLEPAGISVNLLPMECSAPCLLVR